MKFEEKDRGDELEFGFEQHAIGTYVFQFQNGIEKRDGSRKDDPDESVSIMLPCESVEALNDPRTGAGDPNAIHGRMSMFIYLVTKKGDFNKFGATQMTRILDMTGLLEGFAKNLPDDCTYTDDRFINALQIKLPNKLFKGVVEHRKNPTTGNDVANFKKISKYGHQKPEPVQQAAQKTITEEW